jgi:hypothetical protein
MKPGLSEVFIMTISVIILGVGIVVLAYFFFGN